MRERNLSPILLSVSTEACDTVCALPGRELEFLKGAI
jgi:hypothetical protein